MKTRMSLITPRLVLLYVLVVFGRSTSGMEESPSSSLHNQHLNSMLNAMGFDDPTEKRAYTYVSEYKRLPVYNFGIGKRWVASSDDKTGRQFFGKRTKQPYSFGLGKRNLNPDYETMRMSMDYPGVDSPGFHSREQSLEEFLEDKRSRQPYSFGLGKRGWNLVPGETMGTGKRPNDVLSQRYHFGIGKRMSDEEEAMQ